MATAYYPKNGSYVAWTPDMVGALGSKKTNGYYGMTTPAGNDSDWIRTTSSGIIPYTSGSNGSLGTSSWKFSEAYIDNMHGDADRAIYVKDSADGGNISITYAKAGQTSTSWLASWNGKELGSISPNNLTVGEAITANNISWYNDPKAGDITPIGSALSTEHSANRLAFINGKALTIEYSSDGGSTYTDYGYNDKVKSALCTTDINLPVGRADGSTNYTINSRTRITIRAQSYFYTNPRKMLINISSSGGMKVVVEYKTGKNGAVWKTFGEYPLNGWSGWNDIPLVLSTLGGGSSQTDNIWYLRLTFAMTSVSSSSPTTAYISSLRLFGVNDWVSASKENNKGVMSSTGHLYSYDIDANATFPAQITASQFNGSLNGKASSASKADYVNNVTADYNGQITTTNWFAAFEGSQPKIRAISPAYVRTVLNVADGANKYIHPNYTAKASGLYKITVDNLGHVSSTTAVTKSDIPALDYAASSHTHTKAQVGLSNVDNTADSAKSVKYATSAGSANSVAWSNVSGRPTSMPASDVYAWAKASSKPSYSWGEITSKPSTFTPSAHTHDYITVSTTQPTSSTCKIWIKA